MSKRIDNYININCLDITFNLPMVKKFLLESINGSDCFFHLTEAIRFMPLEDWEKFLLDDVGLRIDLRQIDSAEIMHSVIWAKIEFDPEKSYSYQHSNTQQPLHSDNSFLPIQPKLNFFCMQKQSSQGGENFFYCASCLIEDLKCEQPNLLSLLTSTIFEFKKGGNPSNFSEIISFDQSGKAILNWNYYRIISNDSNRSKIVEPFHQFLQTKIPCLPKILSRTGDIFFFNDTRLLHGRNSFLASHKGDRILLQSMWGAQ